jgi:hypothetical protein
MTVSAPTATAAVGALQASMRVDALPWRSAVLGAENPHRHEPGRDRERPPRPFGVLPGMAWEPYEPTRSAAAATLTNRALEALEIAPWLQDVAAMAMRVVSPLFTRGDAPLPDDVPDEPGSWNFVAIGDYGAGTRQLQRVVANIAGARPEFVVTTGDNVYPTGRWIDYRNNWEPYVGPLARSVPFMPALGNHDMYRDDLRPYFGHFPHLQGQAYYTFTQDNAQFFALDSDQELREGSAQHRWLEQSLATSKQPWKVVYLHYPMFGSSTDSYKEISEAVQPLLERHGVQVVVAGHEHNYLRTKPIGGVTHLLTGGGGQRVYPFVSRQPDHLARRVAKYHHVEFSVGKERMVVRAVDQHGRRIDTVEIPVDAVAKARAGAALLR